MNGLEGSFFTFLIYLWGTYKLPKKGVLERFYCLCDQFSDQQICFFFVFFEAKGKKNDKTNWLQYQPSYIQILWFIFAVFLIMIRKSKRGLAKIAKLRPKPLIFLVFFIRSEY